VTLCYPLSYGLCATPSKEDGGALERGTDACLAPAQDGAMTSDQWGASPPSPSALCGHARYHDAISSIAAPSLTLWEFRTTRRHHACRCAPYGLPSATPSSQRTDGDQTGNPHSAALEADPVWEQDSPRRPAGTRFAKTAINSTTLYTIPLHVIRTVRHDCKRNSKRLAILA
jgi:hypothetical protein